MRRALILLPEAPYPVIGGGPLRTASIIEALAPQFQLTAIHYQLAGDPDPATLYPPHLLHQSHTLPLPQHDKSTLPKILRNLKRALRGIPPLVDRFAGHEAALQQILNNQHYDLIWVEHFWAATYAPLLKQHASKLVLNLHNIEHAYYDSLAATSPLHHRPLFQHFAKNARGYEAQLLPHFHLLLTTSEQDKARIEHPQIHVLPNTIPWHDLPAQPRSESIVFTGNFAYTPNQQALHWFLENCWADLLKQKPNLRLRLVGKEIQYAHSSHPNIDYIGPVPDAIEEIAKSRLAIVPLLSGSGTRLKILEAWAAGTPVVSTSLGAEGLEATPGQHLIIANSHHSFTKSVLELFDNEVGSSRITQAARILYETTYTWQSARKILSELDL
jgi:glycosyltransferase involved in cell wall biosynthesis